MDLANAALLIAAVYGIIELAKALLPTRWVADGRVVVLLVLGVSFAATFLVAATTWAHTQVIGGQPLDLMSTADKVLVAVFVAGAASLANRGLGAITNIGQIKPTPVQQAALDIGAQRLVDATFTPS